MKYALKVFFTSNGSGFVAVQRKKGSKLSLVKERIAFFVRCAKTDTFFVTVNYGRLSFWLGTGLSISRNHLLHLICYGKY